MSTPTPTDTPASPPAKPAAPAPAARPKVRFLDLLAGLPALLAGTALLAALAMSSSAATLSTRYETEAKRLREQKDIQGALVCFKRVLGFNPERADVRFNTAM